MYQMKVISVLVVLVIVVLLSLQQTEAKPFRILQRQKRISDQRLAELETLIALSKIQGKLVTIPVGFGRVDPKTLGRRRRSVEQLLQELIRDRSSQEKEEDPEAEGFSSSEEDDREKEDILNRLTFNKELERSGFRHLPVRLPE